MSAVIDAGMPRGGADNRVFNFAVGFSLVFHAALLFSFSMRPQTAPPAAPGPIVARLAPPSAAAPAATPVQPEPPKAQEQTPPPVPEPRPVTKPSPIAKPEPAPKPTAKAAPVAPAAPSAPAAEPAPSTPPPPNPSAAPSAAPGPVAKADPAPTAPAAPAAVDTGTLDSYRISLLEAARRYKRYPRVALDNNWEGKVVIRMIIGPNGLISSISVKTSSGHEVLDKQAVDMIQKAKPMVQIPAALRGREFPIEIPVIYSLKEPTAS